jgi:hypothetical protein
MRSAPSAVRRRGRPLLADKLAEQSTRLFGDITSGRRIVRERDLNQHGSYIPPALENL